MDGSNLLKSETLSSLRLGDIHTEDQQTLITSSATNMHSENFYGTPLPPVALDYASHAALKAPTVGRLRVFKNVISNAQMS